jgi:hypothetical protein
MKNRWSALVVGACLAISPQMAQAAAKKPAHKTAPKIVEKIVPSPVAAPAAKPRGGFMVPNAVVLRPTTPAESEANAIWSLRAALNMAALQCQFSKYLDTVKNYNDFLKQHSDELIKAQTVMLHHFQRYDKARAATSFDQYTTQTYNSYSTLDAQYEFCDSAGLVGREVLTIPKNSLGREAAKRGAEIRAALAQHALTPGLAIIAMPLLSLAPITNSDQ